MIDPHPRSFLYAACWMHENEEWDHACFLPAGMGTAPEAVTHIHPDGVTLVGPPARAERFRRTAEHYSSSVLAREERLFRSITGIAVELSAEQRDYVKDQAERVQRELAYFSLHHARSIDFRFTDEGRWRPRRETVTDIVVGCHALLGCPSPNRNKTADALNRGLPRSSAVCGVSGDFVRNALETFAMSNFRYVDQPADHPLSLVSSLSNLARSYHQYCHLWDVYSERSPHEPIMQFEPDPFRAGKAVELELLNLMSRWLERRLRTVQAAAA